MPPSTLFGMVVAGKLFLALRTAELCTNWVFDFHLDFFFCEVHFDIRDGPRGCKSKNMLIELFVLHCWGFLSPAIVPLPTEMPDGPKISPLHFVCDYINSSELGISDRIEEIGSKPTSVPEIK
jgi:hypothetical protein